MYAEPVLGWMWPTGHHLNRPGFKQFITQLSLTHWFTVSTPCITVFTGWVGLNETSKLDLICNLTFNYFSSTMQIIACTVRYYSHMSLSALSRQRSACDMYKCNKLLMMLGEKCVCSSLFTGNSQALTRPALTCSSPAASSVGPEKPNTCICAASLHADSRLLWWYVVYMIINVDASVHLQRIAWIWVNFLYAGCVVLVTPNYVLGCEQNIFSLESSHMWAERSYIYDVYSYHWMMKIVCFTYLKCHDF